MDPRAIDSWKLVVNRLCDPVPRSRRYLSVLSDLCSRFTFLWCSTYHDARVGIVCNFTDGGNLRSECVIKLELDLSVQGEP